MHDSTRTTRWALAAGAIALGISSIAFADPDQPTGRSLPTEIVVAQAANPCNPCGSNPCASNPCRENPCGANPCGGNPCGSNPCAGAKIDPARFKQPTNTPLASGDSDELLAEGETLWKDRRLGSSGIACATCHTDGVGQMADTFAAPYPHFVKMPHDRAGVSEVSASEMVNFCMMVPMQDEPLPWGSRELAALTAYVEQIQDTFEPSARAPSNPCGTNPCNRNACNPRGANPCNPCAR